MYHHLIGQLGTTVGSPEGEVSYGWPQHDCLLQDDHSVPRHNHSRDVNGIAIGLKGTKYLISQEGKRINRCTYTFLHSSVL